MTQAQDSLSRLTLRQLRYKASDLGVPLYSRKSKAALISEISKYQARRDNEQRNPKPFWKSFENSSSSNSLSDSNSDTRVVFLPRDPEWAYVFWEITEFDRKKALSQGANRLSLRLADVTGGLGTTPYKQALQEVQLDSHSTEWYLPIPLSDRDYRVELGYRSGSRWISLAVSSVARVPALHPSDQILDQFVPFSLEGNPDTQMLEKNIGVDNKDIGLHERLYQTATSNFRKTRVGSEEFQEGFEQNSGFNQSGIGLWASGRNESGIGGVAPRQRSFWLAADAELIVYGSTDPSAHVTIAGEDVPLASDGTFTLQVPFRDGIQNYPIEAKLGAGEQKRNITMKFQRDTPEDNTNPKDQSTQEWF